MATTIIDRLRIALVAVLLMFAFKSFAEVSYGIITSSSNWNVNDVIELTSDGDDLYAATTTMTTGDEFKIVAVENGAVKTWYGAISDGSYWVTETMIKESSAISLTTQDGAPNFQIRVDGEFRFVVDMSDNSPILMVTTVERSITLVSNFECEIVVDDDHPHWGERIKVTAIPHAPYAFNNFVFTKTIDGSSVDITVDEYSRFEMPNFDLTIAASVYELEFYLVGDYNGWTHMGDEPKFSMGDDELWHKTLSLSPDQGIKVVNVGQRLFSATTSSNFSVTDEMIKAQTPIQLEEKGDANDDHDLIAHPIIYLQNEGTREFILDSETMKLTVAGIPHDITLNPVTQGTAQLSTNSARWGESVTITINPMNGYSLTNIEVKAEDGSLIGVIDEVFEMPDQPVTVTVTFEESRYGMCGDNLSWQLNESYNTLTIQGSGPMYDYQMYTQPWLNFKDRITSLYIEEGVETLGNFAFHGMNSLTNFINIPNGVVSIGESCFEYTKISGVELPSSITAIGKNAFNNAEITVINLENCTSPEFTTLPEGAFQNTTLNTVTIPANITSFGDNAFADNHILEEVTLLCASTPQLGNNAFGDVNATLKIDNVDVYHAIRKVGSKWGNANNFTILPLDEKSFRYAIIEGIENGYIYTGQPIELTPQLILCDEILSTDDYVLKYYKGEDEVDEVIDNGTYRCEFTPSDGSDYKDSISKTFIVSDGGMSYIDENGDPQQLPMGTYTEFSEEMTTLTSGWYVVTSDVTVSKRIEVADDGTKILLCDGYTLTAEQGIHCSNKEFAIYGQSANSGKLFANGYDSGAGIGGNIHESGPVLTINGGTIIATSDNSSAAIGGGDQGYWNGTFGSNISITINGGIVTAVSLGYGAGIGGGGCTDAANNIIAGNGGVITINGGQVDASSDFGYGIGPGRIKDFNGNDGEKGNISFGWKNPTDKLTMTSVSGNLVFNRNFAILGENIKATPDNVNNKGDIILLPANVIDIDEGIEHGSVEMDYNACPIGDTRQFSVYVYPDQGYELAEVKAYINNGNSTQGTNSHTTPRSNEEVPLTKVSEHEYIFDMPDANVLITARFEKDEDIVLDVKFGDNKFATWYSNMDLIVPYAVTAYVVSGVEDDKAIIEPVDYIPAGVGVLLYCETSCENIYTGEYHGTTETVTSLLTGSIDSLTVTDGYLLYNDSFVRAQSGTTLPAHRCYLPMNNVLGSPSLLSIVAPGVVTGIEDLTVPASSGQRYNLMGQPVGPNYRGIVIQNGRKILVR